jgi:hypothetical protein
MNNDIEITASSVRDKRIIQPRAGSVSLLPEQVADERMTLLSPQSIPLLRIRSQRQE